METTIIIKFMRRIAGALGAGTLLSWALSPAHAQLPAPSRTIYKCEVKGKVSYSDAPCLGAQRLDVVPTRGVSRLSGTTRTGKDVANEVRAEQFADAIMPLTGMTPPQFATAVRRHHRDGRVQRECGQLEAAILALERAERRAEGAVESAMESVQQDLFILRKRYKTLDC